MSFIDNIRRSLIQEPKPEVSEQELEKRALHQFNQNIASQRASVSLASQPYQQQHHGRPQRAPGFDYVNWKPYGVIRYDRGPDVYEQQARGLAPYVHSVLESGCLGSEERRWKNMTQPVDTNSRPLHMGSRAGSRDILGSRVPSRDMM